MTQHTAASVGAFMPGEQFRIDGRAGGPLSGLTFAAKDIYDVAGHPTGFGNPTWLATHPVPTANAALVQRVLDAGATLVGKVITDELAYSINGDNFHYGTPVNVNAPGRVPGGSSSGSGAAAAARLCDFALGTDTGGSVRVPASFCGVWGIRPTHGILPGAGVLPFAPSYDSFGWLASDRGVFQRVADVLLPASNVAWRRVLVADDAWTQADEEMRPWLERAMEILEGAIAKPERSAVAGDLEAWRKTYLTVSAREAWQTHGEWIDREKPVFGPPIAQRFAYAKTVTEADGRAGIEDRERIALRVREWLGPDGVAILPTAAGPAPRIDAAPADVDAFRLRTIRITSIAGHARLPQVSVPVTGASGLPLGISLMGPAGSDRALVDLAVRLLGDGFAR